MAEDKKYFLISGLFGLFSLTLGYYLLWILENNLGWVFLALAVINYLRVQRKIRKL